MGEDEHLTILKAIIQIPFPVGRKLLADFLVGSLKNASVIKNELDEYPLFGELSHKRPDQLMTEIDELIKKDLLEQSASSFNHMIKVLKITIRGQNELANPQMKEKEEEKTNYSYESAEITPVDQELFSALNDFLSEYNDEQKKSIVDNSEKILCIAGAGSGKTTVLTKRVEFLTKYRSVPTEKVLAITFTRKAREEMQFRLADLGIRCHVETFNSFCEKILRKFEAEIYGRQIRVIRYNDKIMAMMGALDSIGIDMPSAINTYFSQQQLRNNTPEKLQNIFMNDCFSVLEYYKSKNKKVEDFSEKSKLENFKTSKMIFNICKSLENYMEVQGLRDFTSQLTDAVTFLKQNPDKMPKFEHILVDEYQDINDVQIELIDLLNAPNLFCVGDPRQSIFGWRGSNIEYIKNFCERYPSAQTIILSKNYRSNNHIVEFMNKSIVDMNLPDVDTNRESDNDIKLFTFSNEMEEYSHVIEKILKSDLPRNEIFVLSRTNRQINGISILLKQNNIAHILKTDDVRNSGEARRNEITLATIHSIKGLEAKHVFIMGCQEQNFPCKATDHPVLEMIKMHDYERIDEEKRLFYVAISRAKDSLYMSYTGKKPTYFITDEMMEMLEKVD